MQVAKMPTPATAGAALDGPGRWSREAFGRFQGRQTVEGDSPA